MKVPEKNARHGEAEYDVVIIGGGVSGTALLYALSRYTDIGKMALFEKYAALGQVNSNATNNSQTLHVGEIETNYTIEKARQVKPAAMMVKRYVDRLPEERRQGLMRPTQKMVLAVGAGEVESLEKRYEALREVFPALRKLGGKEIGEEEPEVMRGREAGEAVLALFNPEGFAVNYGLLAKSLGEEAQREAPGRAEVFLEHEARAIEPSGEGYMVHTARGSFRASVVVVDADAYSLGFAKRLGYGKEFSLIPIAGSFYFTPPKLSGKVYRVQDPKMPFAAVHGDPDLTKDGATRWGPTARFFPVLEARKFATSAAFFSSSGLHRLRTWVSFVSILLEPARFWYLLKNLVYDIPLVGTYAFLPQVRKIVPTLRARDLARARGYGGMRLQRVDTRTRELLLGEGKIVGENIIFNMTPSPGASVCLYNAMRDAEQITKFAPRFTFDKARMVEELCPPSLPPSGDDVSLKASYAS